MSTRPIRPVEGQPSEAAEAAKPSYYYLVSTGTEPVNPDDIDFDYYLVSVTEVSDVAAQLFVRSFSSLVGQFAIDIRCADVVLSAFTYRDGCLDLQVDSLHIDDPHALHTVFAEILPTAIRLAYEARMSVEGYNEGFYGLSDDVAELQRDVQVIDVTARVKAVLR